MKRTLLMFLFLSYGLLSFAPTQTQFYIAESNAVIDLKNCYEPVVNAIGWFEAHNNDSAYNRKEDAYGRLQIRRSSGRVEHFNLATKKNYTYEDMFDFKKAREVFLYYAQDKTQEQATKDWNGSGIMTVVYWMNIKNIINGKNVPIIRVYSKQEAIDYLASLV